MTAYSFVKIQMLFIHINLTFQYHFMWKCDEFVRISKETVNLWGNFTGNKTGSEIFQSSHRLKNVSQTPIKPFKPIKLFKPQ